jgi:hypothetical protein
VNPSMEARSRHPWRSRPRNRTHPAFDRPRDLLNMPMGSDPFSAGKRI